MRRPFILPITDCEIPVPGAKTVMIVRPPFLPGELFPDECRLLPAKITITRDRWSNNAGSSFKPAPSIHGKLPEI